MRGRVRRCVLLRSHMLRATVLRGSHVLRSSCVLRCSHVLWCGCVFWRGEMVRRGARRLDASRGRMVNCGRIRACNRRRDGAAVIRRRERRVVRRSEASVLHLNVGRSEVLSALEGLFARRRARRDPAAAAVVAYVVPVVVRHRAIVIDVSDDGPVDVGDRGVVLKLAAAPSSSLVTATVVAVAIVHAAVPAHLRRSISRRPNEREPVPTPKAGRPPQSVLRSGHPGAGNPVVAARTIGPVAGRPDPIRLGVRRLHVIGDWRRPEAYGNADRLRAHGHRQRREDHGKRKERHQNFRQHDCFAQYPSLEMLNGRGPHVRVGRRDLLRISREFRIPDTAADARDLE